jgi:exodeoxyribonuclease VII large subunit
VNIKLFPAQVQGAGAADTICNGISYFNETKNVDVIIIARGGGSLEDLWPFNEEKTAWAIYNSAIPVISAVGHETDFTIADFVADLRAPTPSAAGELAVPQYDEVVWKIDNLKYRLKNSLSKKTSNLRVKLDSINSSRVFKNPISMLESKILRLENLNKQIENTTSITIKNKKIKLVEKMTALDGLSPLKTLSRGYSMVLDSKDNIVKSSKALNKGDKIKINMHDGNVEASVL